MRKEGHNNKHSRDSRCGVGEICCGVRGGGLEMCAGRLDVFLTGCVTQCEL